MTTDPNESVDFDLVPPDQAWMFANSRLTPEQLASANRVWKHAIEGDVRVHRDAETTDEPSEPATGEP